MVIRLDGTGPEGAKTFAGQAVVGTRDPAGRARQGIDHGRRGKGYILGAFQPATGAAFTQPCPSRGTANRTALLEEVEGWPPADAERVHAIVDNPGTHRATDVPPFMPAHPRRGMVFQPRYAARPNLIEPWWKVPRSPALKGRRFEGREDIAQAVARATAYWHAHRHPFVRGRRRRHKPRRQPGIALPPKAA